MTLKKSQHIVPSLWFDDQAEQAAQWYSEVFDNSGIEQVTHYAEAAAKGAGRPAGSVMTVLFKLAGQNFVALNGGPLFKFTPAISFFVTCETEAEVDKLWGHLSEGGMELMPLDKYDWSEKYGWIQDQFGLSWQLSLGKIEGVGQKITPSFLFSGDQLGKAGDAIDQYTRIFKNSTIDGVLRYGPDENQPEGIIKHAQFRLDGQTFMIMESSMAHGFTFNESVSFVVNCDTQEEIDYFWTELSAGGEEQPCGWLKDAYGVSWQVVPSVLPSLLSGQEDGKSERVMGALFQMKKLDIATLETAYNGQLPKYKTSKEL